MAMAQEEKKADMISQKEIDALLEVESNLTATAEELDRERSRFHWREAIASAITTAMIIVVGYLIVALVDLITGYDEETPAAAIEETRREPARTPATTTQPAAKAPIKKRFGTGK